ncbi:outer membrane biogenesis protein BamB [Rubripirellula amarantea]|uniref:Outer membrane biogenesis protein BamB n=1 Tax=Rubripirellula amarantea TaxID=2527999 RepID=A0A5C5WRZ7_9BACT|nr:PQQ-binding-like beta-propeller repeat protein [Rubripirellula amarantea]TWT53674.1 outer membrane biogenesis protein BamB [Rubripirellula amarantea]
MNLRVVMFAFAASLLLPVASRAEPIDENWHQWRGPDATGVSKTANPPIAWSEEENIKWKVAIQGQGTSTPIIWGNKVFVLTAINTGENDPAIPDPQDQPKTNYFDIKRPNARHEFVVLCLDRNTGKEIWRDIATKKIPHEGAHNDNDFASASPTTDGNQLYCWFGSAGLFCYDLDGNQLWERELGEARVGSSLGEGCSPVVHQDKLVIVRDHNRQGAIEVLDTKTGETLWRKARNEDNAWATPLVVTHSGRTQVVTAASDFVRSYDLDSGDIIWQCSGLTGNVTPCPVVEGDHVICMSGYEGYSAMAIPLTQTGDLSGSEKILWKKNKGTPYVPSPLLYDGLLYYSQSNQSILTCLDSKSGEVVFGPERVGQLSNIYASPVGASDRVYITGRNGVTVVLNRSLKFELIQTNQLDERFDASPAIAGNQLFLRGAEYLYCIEAE